MLARQTCAGLRQSSCVGSQQRIQPSNPGITGINPAGLGNLGPARLGTLKCGKLERLLRIPAVRHVRDKRTDQAATGAAAALQGLKHGYGGAALETGPGD